MWKPATAAGSPSTGRVSGSVTDRTLTYSELAAEVSKAANALTDLGLVAGDRVAIYLPMIPEAMVAMLACARLGVLHSVVFAGFTATALGARIDDAEAKLLITADGQFRRGKPASLKEAADQAVADADSIEHVLVVRRTGADITWTEGRDVWWHDVVDSASLSTGPRRSTPSTRCSCSTPRVPPASPRASCTPAAAI